MDIICRFFIVIWTIIFVCLMMCGGFVLFPILRYIFIGEIGNEPFYDLWKYGKDHIEKFFNCYN